MVLKKILPYSITLFLFIGILYYIAPIGQFFIRREAGAILFIKNIYHAQNFAERYSELAKENEKNINQLALLKNIERENAFLKKRLDIAPEEGKKRQHLVLASVIGRNNAFGENTILIDKGIKDAIKSGESVVVSPNFLVGIIDKAFDDRSIVRLIIDKGFEVKAKTLDGTKGIIRGSIGGNLLFQNILQSASLQKGETVATDIQDATRFANILIGEITEIISQKTDISKQARIKPFFDPQTLENVFIMLE